MINIEDESEEEMESMVLLEGKKKMCIKVHES